MKPTLLKHGALVLGVVVLAGAGIFAGAKFRAARIVARHESQLAACFAEIRSRDGKKPAIGGDPIPGNGWDLYQEALAAVEAIPKKELDVFPCFSLAEDPKIDPQAVAAFIAKHETPIELLLRLPRATYFKPAYAYELGMEMDLKDSSKVYSAAQMLCGLAQYYAHQQMPGEASRMLVAAMSLGRDCARDAPLLHTLVEEGVAKSAVEVLRVALSTQRIPVAALSEILEVINTLQAQRSSVLAIAAFELAYFRQTLVRVANGTITGIPASMGLITAPANWRYLWSLDVLLASALEDASALEVSIAAIGELPSHAWHAAGENLSVSYQATANPFVELVLGALVGTFRKGARFEMNLALSRVALAVARYHAANGRFPVALAELVPDYLPEIPLRGYTGQPLRYAPGKVWSPGLDGDDDGGVHITEPYDPKAEGDIVWTVLGE